MLLDKHMFNYIKSYNEHIPHLLVNYSQPYYVNMANGRLAVPNEKFRVRHNLRRIQKFIYKLSNCS